MSTTTAPDSTIASSSQIGHESGRLTRRVEAIEARLRQNGSPAPPPTPFDFDSIRDQVREITRNLFPGKCEFTNDFDPEYPEDRYIVVNVEATGDVKEIAERGCVWDERIRQLSKNSFRNLRLSIVPR